MICEREGMWIVCERIWYVRGCIMEGMRDVTPAGTC